ncbi:MAG TPA: histone deacetylase family protein [Acetobacteraceae bacterium]|jgi:acetoin utilization deacetylase AcuC-like enzyme|nr:histone deacetylase family protein [Acetobacteraceae bacterium]
MMRAFWDPAQLAHDPQFFLQRGTVKRNLERPARAEALLAACRAMRMEITPPPAPPRSALEAVHPPDYLDFLRDAPAAWAALPDHGAELVPNIHPSPEMFASGARRSATVIGQLGWFTADTSCPIAPATWPAAQAAAACAIAAADIAGSGGTAYALARPPGHHAYPARAGGHCYLNNAAIAAERLRAQGAARVAVLDIDSHHGNGTQGIFWTRDDVLFVSIHGDPNGYYPWYVGHAGERGAGGGAGFTLNLPLPQGADDAAWLRAIDAGLRAITRYRPDALVLSLGFDASRDEPLGFLAVSDDGFARAGHAIGALGLPAAIIQEGGYNTEVIGRLLTRVIEGLAGG